MIQQLSELPDGILDARASDLYRILGGPSVIYLQGRRDPPVFITVLQHGNEDSGWEAVRSWLKANHRDLPRSMVIFLANVEAARYGLRRLDHQPDFNRCWPGAPKAATALHRALASLTDLMRQQGLFLSLDMHNNTGANPHYAAITRLNPASVFLANQFERQAVYYRVPSGTQCDAFSSICPSLTLELGMAGTTDALPRCERFLDFCMNLESLPDAYVPSEDFELFQIVARASVSPEIDFAFEADANCEVRFRTDLEDFNFVTLDSGTELALLHMQEGQPVYATTETGDDVTDHYFAVQGGRLNVNRPFVAAMLTRDRRVVRQDCLCYVMERIDHGLGPPHMTPIYLT